MYSTVTTPFFTKRLPAETAGGSPLAFGSGSIFGIRPLCKEQFQHSSDFCTDNGDVRPKLSMSDVVPGIGIPALMIFVSLEFEWLSDRNDSSRIQDSSNLLVPGHHPPPRQLSKKHANTRMLCAMNHEPCLGFTPQLNPEL